MNYNITAEVGKDRIRVAIRIGSCDPEEVTRLVGLTPTLAGRIGDPRYNEDGHIIGYRTEHLWHMDSPDYPSGTLEQQLDSLLNAVVPRVAGLRQLPVESNVFVCCAVTTYSERPSIFITKSQIKGLSAIGAELDIDVYDYSS